MPDASRCITRLRSSVDARARLFAFPYAGGTARIYRPLLDVVPNTVDVCALEYPGRGTRYGEKPLTSLADLVESIGLELVPWLDRPFAFFGYSMGALVAFEAVRWLSARGARAPSALLVAAARGPHVIDPRPPTYALPDRAFIDGLRALGGIPDEIFVHPELLARLLPIVRADLELTQTYRYVDGPPLDVPIEAYGGTSDPLASPGELDAWRAQTTAGFELHLFEGGHFFMHSPGAGLLPTLSRRVTELFAET